MALDKLLIGTRVRKVREDGFKETRKLFSERCDLTETHIGQIERGEILIGLSAMDKIIDCTGTSADYILYGKNDKKKSAVRNNIDNYLDSCSEEELKMYFRCISSIRSYIINIDKKD